MLKHWEKNRLIIRASSSLLVLFLFSLVAYPNFLPGRSFAEPGVITNPSISITPSTNANISLYPGMFGTATQTISATTTNYTGYVLTFSTEGASTSLVNTEDDTITIPTITLPSGRTSITSSGFASNTYGYSLNGTDFKPVPAINEELTLISTDSANVSADTRTLTFGAIVDTTVAPGTFINTFDLSATANEVGYLISYVANAGADEVSGMPVPNPEPEPTSGLVVSLSDAKPEREGYRFMGWAEDSEATEPDYAPSDDILLDPETSNITTLYAVWKKLYAIIYDGNGADGGSMAMVTHENVAEGQTVDLYASNYNRDGYGFLGWSFDKNAAETLGTANESVIYGPNEEIIAPEYGEDEIIIGDTLVRYIYAIWLESSGTIQGWAGCSSLNAGDVIALTDSRDNNTYAITKHANGRCWMMENLRLSLDQPGTVTKANTNNPTDYFISLYSNGAAPTSWGGWGSGYWGYKYNNNNINRSKTPSPINNDDSSSWYSYGVYYSWSTAMAGNATELSGDICPMGWRFPTQTESSIFINSLNSAKDARKYPNNLVLSGYYSYISIEADWPYDYVIQRRGKAAYYALSDSHASLSDLDDDSLFISTTSIHNDNGYGYRARAARCFAKESTTATLTYDANGGTNAPSPTTSAPGTGLYTFTTSSAIPTRTGYIFAGWIDEEGSEVSSNSTYVSYQTSTKLYAIWTNDSCNTNATTISTGNSATDAVCLQDMNQTVKNSMTSLETYNLIDARDGISYTVSKLDDGNVWMTQNLALHFNNDILLTSYDTDLNSGSIYKLLTTNYLYNDSYGTFFNWQTSIADLKSDYLTLTISTSICPVGWDLPTSMHFSQLQREASFNSAKKPSSSPYSFDTGGGFYNGTTQYNSGYSYYWTSSSSNTSIAFGAYNTGNTISVTSNSGTSSGSGANKYYRRNLRCIANNGTATITYYGNGSIDYPVETPTQVERTVALNDGIVGQNLFTRDHYTFDKWNTAANGSGTQVAVNTLVASLGGNYDLYAQWLPNLQIVHHSNDNNQSTKESEVVTGGNWKTLKDNAFTSYDGHSKIVSWNTEPDGSGTTYNLDTQYTASSNMSEPETLDLYAQWVPTYSIVYNGNGSTDGSMDNGRQDSISLGEMVSLIASNYSKTGYGFAGWSLNPNAIVNSNYTIYGPNEQIEITSDFLSHNVNGVITLYAVWVAPSGTFQTFDADDYLNSPTGTVLALRDERDDNIYAIAKLADGQWWMIENMRLQLASYGETANNKTILGAKSITNGTVTRLTIYNTDKPAISFLETDSFADDWKLIGNYSYSSGSRFYEEETNQINFGIGNIDRQNEASPTHQTTSQGGPHQDKSWYSYGVMYNWFTATAGNGGWGGTSGTNATGSICPLGWHLPSGATDGDTQTLKSLINSFSEYPNNIVKTGYYYTGPYTSTSISAANYYRASKYRGENDNYYWTSTFGATNANVSSAYTINTNMSSTSTITAYKILGAAVRCIATPQTEYTLEYNANGGENAPNSQTVTNNSGIFEHISSDTPTRSNHVFVRWTDEYGNSYSPNDMLTARSTTTTLYAVWSNTLCNTNASTIDTGNTATDAICLQDMNRAVKNSMISKETYTLIDARDQKEYTISKLDDGNVWMTQNLSIGSDSTMLLTYLDSDLADNTYFFLPASTSTFGTNYYIPQFYASDNYGGYYSWAAAIGDAVNSPSFGTVTSSICPSNWDLPTTSNYDNLRSMAGITTVAKISAAPYNFTTGGYLYQSTISASSSTYLWTSNPNNESYAYYSNVYQASSSSKYLTKSNGGTIRCMASNGKVTIHYDGNGSEDYPTTNSTASQIDVEVNTASIRSNSFVRTGFSFRGWNTEPDGSGTTVTGKIGTYGFEDGDVITLYAQWAPIYTINYYSNDTTNSRLTYTAIAGNSWYSQPPTLFTSIYDNMKIGSWNTMPDGSGTTYNVSTSYNTPSGMTIPTAINLYAQWVTTYTFKYDGNGADEGNMTNVTHTNAGVGNYIDLAAPNYSKNNYGFAGWSPDANATIGGNSIIYGPNERITITNELATYSVNNEIILYAVWVPVSGTMQDFDCSTLTVNDVIVLRDTRDNSVYTVSKIADNGSGYNKCWMTSNLTLNNTYNDNGATVPVVLNTDNTQGLGGVFTNLANPETTNFSSSTTANSLYSSSNITGNYVSNRIPRYNNANTVSRDTNPSMTDSRMTNSSTSLNKNIYSYGNYYNWPAAIADTDDHYSGGATNITSSSICPKGWHLPTGDNNGEYQGLLTILQNNSAYPANYPYNFIKNGKYSSSAPTNRGSSGYYWAATAIYNYGYAFYFYGGFVGRISSTQDYHYKYNGYAVRCVADDTEGELEQNPESAAPTTETPSDDIITNIDQETEEEPETSEEENEDDEEPETTEPEIIDEELNEKPTENEPDTEPEKDEPPFPLD